MPWYSYLLHALSAGLLINSVPHLAMGLTGTPFQSPFATPSGIGESSPRVNVWWGWANLVGGAVLLAKYTPADNLGWIIFAVTPLLLGTPMATHFGKVRARARAQARTQAAE